MFLPDLTDTRRKNNIIIASKRRRYVHITSYVRWDTLVIITLASGSSYDNPSPSEAKLRNMGECISWIHNNDNVIKT